MQEHDCGWFDRDCNVFTISMQKVVSEEVNEWQFEIKAGAAIRLNEIDSIVIVPPKSVTMRCEDHAFVASCTFQAWASAIMSFLSKRNLGGGVIVSDFREEIGIIKIPVVESRIRVSKPIKPG